MGHFIIKICIQHTLKRKRFGSATTHAAEPGFKQWEALSVVCVQAIESGFVCTRIAPETASKTTRSGWWKWHLQRPMAIEGNNYQAMHFLYVVSSVCVWICFLTVLYQAHVASDNTKAVRKQRRRWFLIAYITVFMSSLLSGVWPMLTRHWINSHPHVILQEICRMAQTVYIYSYSTVSVSFGCAYCRLCCTYHLLYFQKFFYP